MDSREQALTDEVLYLHSLWHHGPHRDAVPNPNPNHNNNLWRRLQPSSSVPFKRNGARRGKKQLPVSDLEWPCNPLPDPRSGTASGWPVLKPRSTRATPLPTAEEQARFVANQAQQKGLKAAQEFFASNVDSDGDDSDEDTENEGDAGRHGGGYEEYNFLLKLFMEENEVRCYYEKYCKGGDFWCLVCGGAGKRVGKRFKDCVALVQHSISIAKSKSRAHRAYGRVICKVLGWDINRLPTTVSSMGKSQESGDGGMEGASKLGEDSILETGNGAELILREVSDASQNEELQHTSVDGSFNVDSDVLMVCESAVKNSDDSRNGEDLDQGFSSMMEGNAEGVVNCLCRNLSRRMALEMK